MNSQLHTLSVYAWDKWQTNSRSIGVSAMGITAVPVRNWSTAYAAVSL